MIKTFEDAKAEVEKFEKLQSKLSKFGAYDSEPCGYFNRIIRRVFVDGKDVDEVIGHPEQNPWELYQSVRGWLGACKKLDAATRRLIAKLQKAPFAVVRRLLEYYGWDR